VWTRYREKQLQLETMTEAAHMRMQRLHDRNCAAMAEFIHANFAVRKRHQNSGIAIQPINTRVVHIIVSEIDDLEI
jgi:hypothetical protein